MQRLFVAVGELPNGGVTGLYVGKDADAALAAIEKAGQAGEITCGFFIRNPSVSRRLSFVRSPSETEAAKTTGAIRAEQAAVTAQAKALGAKAADAAVAAIKDVIAGAVAAPDAPVAAGADESQAPANDAPEDSGDANHFAPGPKARRR